MEPISISIFNLKRSALSSQKCYTAIDSGGTLTKIVYVPKDCKFCENNEYLPITCVLYSNRNFRFAILWIKTHALLREDAIIRVTGLNGEKNMYIYSIIKTITFSYFYLKRS